MDGLLLINKDKGYTSRDCINILSKVLNTKKIGHFGTLDPLATGLLVVGVGKYTKAQKILDKEVKEYEVTVLIGKSTDTYDITGNVLWEDNYKGDTDKITKALLSFKGSYMQEVPIYSAVKVNGKKLYEYARCNIDVKLPKKEVNVFSIDNIKIKDNFLYFRCKVSKGFYIRSLINDLSLKLNIPMCMADLKRISIDNFSINDSYTLENIKNGNFKFYDVSKLFNYKKIEIDAVLEKKILNGSKLDNIYNLDNVLFTKNNKLFALYRKNDCNMLVKTFIF